jgi:hypothetical protein
MIKLLNFFMKVLHVDKTYDALPSGRTLPVPNDGGAGEGLKGL